MPFLEIQVVQDRFNFCFSGIWIVNYRLIEKVGHFNAGFALPVAIVAKCEEKIFLAQKKFIWRKQVAKKNSPPKKSAS